MHIIQYYSYDDCYLFLDIETEKNPASSHSSSPPPPPPPPLPSQAPSSSSSMKVKSRVLSPISKKGVPPKDTTKVSSQYKHQLSQRTDLDEDRRLKSVPRLFSGKKSQVISIKSDVSNEMSSKKAVSSKRLVLSAGKVSIDEQSVPRLSLAKKHQVSHISEERPPKKTVTSEPSVSQSPVKVTSEPKPKKSQHDTKKKGKK